MTHKQITDQIKSIIKHHNITGLNFDEILSQIKKGKNRIVFYGEIDRQKVTVKYCANKFASDVKNILNETSVLNYFSKEKCDFQSKIFASNVGSHPWLIKGYLGGKPGGKLLDFKDDFINHVSPEKVIDVIKEYKEFHPKLIWSYSDLANDYSDNINFIDKFIPDKFIGRDGWVKYFNKSIMSRKCKKYLSHNDLNAGNVLYDTEGNFRIIDWENAGFDTYQKDFANIFHMAYNYPKWQKKFIKKMNFTIPDQMEFNAWAIYLLLFNSAGLKKMKSKNEKSYYRSGNFTNKQIEQYNIKSSERVNILSRIFN